MSKKLKAFRLPEKTISRLEKFSEFSEIPQAVLVEKSIELYLSTKIKSDNQIYKKPSDVIQENEVVL